MANDREHSNDLRAGSEASAIERRPIAAVNRVGGWAPAGTPGWGSLWKARLIENLDRTDAAYIQRTTRPCVGNFLDLDPTARDPLRYPVIRITARFRNNERNMGPYLAERMRQW